MVDLSRIVTDKRYIEDGEIITKPLKEIYEKEEIEKACDQARALYEDMFSVKKTCTLAVLENRAESECFKSIANKEPAVLFLAAVAAQPLNAVVKDKNERLSSTTDLSFLVKPEDDTFRERVTLIDRNEHIRAIEDTVLIPEWECVTQEIVSDGEDFARVLYSLKKNPANDDFVDIFVLQKI